MNEITDFDWDEFNIKKVWAHGVIPEDAEEVLYNDPLVRRTHSRRFIALGQTDEGRYLIVIYELKKPTVVRIISAWNAKLNQRRKYQKEKQ